MIAPAAVVASYERGTHAVPLHALQLMDTAPDREFDDLVALAAAICGKPMGAVTLLNEASLFIKARVDLNNPKILLDEPRTIPVEQSMCQFTVQGQKLLMVGDLDESGDVEPLRVLRATSGIRFYAGMPLIGDCGAPVGALCVMDSEPATLTLEQQGALKILAQQVSNLIQARKHARELERVAAERDKVQHMFDTILNSLPVSIYLKDADGHFRFYNQALADRFGIDRKEWLGKSSYDLWTKEIADDIAQDDKAVLQSGEPHVSFVSIQEKEGFTSHWRSNKVPCMDVYGEPLLACCSVDLTEQIEREKEVKRTRDELEEANRKLSSLALTDALTGLWNRRAFNAQLETQIIASHRKGLPMSLMLVDVDHFKSVNDRFGHPYGDLVLKEIAAVLNRAKRGDDIACRFGGEEFAILLPGTELKSARYLADRVLKAIRDHAWEKSPVTVSIGMAMCGPNCLSDDLVDEADAALYRAKRGGRDRVVLHTDPE